MDTEDVPNSQSTNTDTFGQQSFESYPSFVVVVDDGPSEPQKRRGTIDFITTKVAAALDKCKVSSRNVVHLVGAFAEVFNIDRDSLVLNKSSIHKKRKKSVKKGQGLLKNLSKKIIFNI